MRRSQAFASCIRRMPSAPLVQKNSFSGVSWGSGRIVILSWPRPFGTARVVRAEIARRGETRPSTQVTAPAIRSARISSSPSPSSDRISSPCSLNSGARRVWAGASSNWTGVVTSSKDVPAFVSVFVM